MGIPSQINIVKHCNLKSYGAGDYFDYDNLEFEEEADEYLIEENKGEDDGDYGIQLDSEFDVDDYMFEHEANFEDPSSANIEGIVPGFVGWVKYGGKYQLGEVITNLSLDLMSL